MTPHMSSAIDVFSILAPRLTGSPSDYVVRGLVQAAANRGFEVINQPRNRLLSRLPKPSRRRSHCILTPMMGPNRRDLLRYSRQFGQPVPYCWDVWEPNLTKWVSLFTEFEIEFAFVSSRDGATLLSQLVPDLRVVHMPEAITSGDYGPGRELSERSLDILEVGRRYANWHETLVHGLSDGISHLYEKSPGQIIFKDRQALVAGLANSRLLVCFPSSITHPARSGGVNTLTSRYLEGFASRSVVLGSAPHDADAVGADKWIIAVDWADPVRQVEYILRNIGDLQDFVNDASGAMSEVSDWSVRIDDILKSIVTTEDSPDE